MRLVVRLPVSRGRPLLAQRNRYLPSRGVPDLLIDNLPSDVFDSLWIFGRQRGDDRRR